MRCFSWPFSRLSSSIVFFVNSRIAPTLPPELLKPPTPTPNIFSTPLSSPTPLGTRGADREVVTPSFARNSHACWARCRLPEKSQQPRKLCRRRRQRCLCHLHPLLTVRSDLNISEPRNGAAVSGNISFSGHGRYRQFPILYLGDKRAADQRTVGFIVGQAG